MQGEASALRKEKLRDAQTARKLCIQLLFGTSSLIRLQSTGTVYYGSNALGSPVIDTRIHTQAGTQLLQHAFEH